ncbi:MAG: 3-deoxy-8-phosphooctulonate synthase [Bacteroidales bacterium]|nr:3-deoxy-8-phosphooctulonate synthase [Bacteroidales bacterium]
MNSSLFNSLLSSENYFLLAGPCVVESRELCFEVAEQVKNITTELNIPYIFKASYRKANRSRIDSFSGIGDEKALQVLSDVKDRYGIPVVTDIHSAEEAAFAAQVADILQIPAFLCRQTDILVAAANTGKIVNIKKGQFLAPSSMKHVAQKVVDSGNKQVMLTDRGTMFGYGDLIVDFRGIPEMKAFGFPVVLDITHSLQQPNQQSGVSGGRPDMIETIARAGIAVGVNGLFIETHPDPLQAKSDGANMLSLDLLPKLLKNLLKLNKTVKSL